MPVCFRRGWLNLYVHPDRHRTLVKANKGRVWHKSSMEQGIVPRSGIDMDAHGFSHTKVGVFGCNLHVASSTGPVAVPLSAEVTTANIQDSQAYGTLASSLPAETIRKAHFMAADPGIPTIRVCMNWQVQTFGVPACVSSLLIIKILHNKDQK